MLFVQQPTLQGGSIDRLTYVSRDSFIEACKKPVRERKKALCTSVAVSSILHCSQPQVLAFRTAMKTLACVALLLLLAVTGAVQVVAHNVMEPASYRLTAAAGGSWGRQLVRQTEQAPQELLPPATAPTSCIMQVLRDHQNFRHLCVNYLLWLGLVLPAHAARYSCFDCCCVRSVER